MENGDAIFPVVQVAFIIGQSFLSTLCALRWGTFVIYAAFVVVAVIFVMLFIPETKVSENSQHVSMWFSPSLRRPPNVRKHYLCSLII